LAEDNLGTDLFGDLVILSRDGPGRPEHKWSRENSNKVLLAFARGLSVKQAATAIGVSAPTLRKVYFSEVAKRAAAGLRMEMTQLARLNVLAEGGNVSAEKELAKQLERMRLRDLAGQIAEAHAERPRKLSIGKKEQQKRAAERAGEGSDWGTDLQPPPLIN
jgi:hypothetical protein